MIECRLAQQPLFSRPLSAVVAGLRGPSWVDWPQQYTRMTSHSFKWVKTDGMALELSLESVCQSSNATWTTSNGDQKRTGSSNKWVDQVSTRPRNTSVKLKQPISMYLIRIGACLLSSALLAARFPPGVVGLAAADDVGICSWIGPPPHFQLFNTRVDSRVD